jgi:hypothetical protein
VIRLECRAYEEDGDEPIRGSDVEHIADAIQIAVRTRRALRVLGFVDVEATLATGDMTVYLHGHHETSGRGMKQRQEGGK